VPLHYHHTSYLFTTMTKTDGSSDLRQRIRRKCTESEKAASRRERERKKRKTEAEIREKNKAKGWFSVPASARRNEPDVDQRGPLDIRDGSDGDDDEDDDDSMLILLNQVYYYRQPLHRLKTTVLLPTWIWKKMTISKMRRKKMT
jgi:hypothetical protein